MPPARLSHRKPVPSQACLTAYVLPVLLFFLFCLLESTQEKNHMPTCPCPSSSFLP